MDKKLPVHLQAMYDKIDIAREKEENIYLRYLYTHLLIEMHHNCTGYLSLDSTAKRNLLIGYAMLDGSEPMEFYMTCLYAATQCHVFPAGLWGQIWVDKMGDHNRLPKLNNASSTENKIAILSFDNESDTTESFLDFFTNFCANDESYREAA